MTVSARPARRVIVNFHGIGEPPGTAPADELEYWCPAVEWRRLIEVIAEASLEGWRVEVTFDDGNASDVEQALPALLEHQLTATFHVCAGRIGRRGYLDEGMLNKLRTAGMRIGSHGWNHVDLRVLSDADLDKEARESQLQISDACGAAVTAFAVPLGSYDRRVLRQLRPYGTVYTSDATVAVEGSWLTPRWSYVRGWTAESVGNLARRGESMPHRLRQRLAIQAKRWR